MKPEEQVICFKEYEKWYLGISNEGRLTVGLDDAFQAGWFAATRSRDAPATSQTPAEPFIAKDRELCTERCDRCGRP